MRANTLFMPQEFHAEGHLRLQFAKSFAPNRFCQSSLVGVNL